MLYKTLESEEDAFYCFIYIMEEKNWKLCFDATTSKLVILLEFFKQIIEGAFIELYEHLSNEIDEDWLTVAFQSIVSCVFIYDCQDSVATHIFDVFLLDGEEVILTLIVKML